MNNKKINTYYVYEEGESEEKSFMIEIPNSVNYNIILKDIIGKKLGHNKFEILNDVSGFKDSEMIELAADKKSKIILVHNHPESHHIHEKMEFKNVVQEVKAHLESKIISLISYGIKENQISIDPGLGFGKTMNDSRLLFESLDTFCFGFPLIVGYSKKKFTETLNLTDSQLYQHCIDSGAAFVRLHIAS